MLNMKRHRPFNETTTLETRSHLIRYLGKPSTRCRNLNCFESLPHHESVKPFFKFINPLKTLRAIVLFIINQLLNTRIRGMPRINRLLIMILC